MSKNNNKTEYDPDPTINQKKALEKMLEKVENGEKIKIGEIMREVGYSKSTSEHPEKLTKSKGFQKLLDEVVNERELIKTQNKIAKQDKEKTASTRAFKELMKLRDRYPSKKHNVRISHDQEELVE